MSLSKYQIFLRTVECGSFTKAAESMSFTQSGVSHAVQSLEDELGVCLLSRSRGGVTLTADGRALLPQIQRLCTEHHRLVQAAADLKGMESGLVKVASFSSVSAQWLPLILKSFSKLYPNIEFEMLTGDYYDQIESWIVSGEADCNPFPVETIATEPFIRLEEGDDYEIRAALDEMGVHPHVRYTAREDRTILAMVSNGLGISLLPELMVRNSPYPIVICQPPRSFYRQIAIAVKDKKAISNSTRLFVDHVRRWVAENGNK